MFLVISLFLFWLTARKEAWLWLVLPLSLFFDFWDQTSLGFSGLKMLFVWLIFWLFLGHLVAKKSKFRF